MKLYPSSLCGWSCQPDCLLLEFSSIQDKTAFKDLNVSVMLQGLGIMSYYFDPFICAPGGHVVVFSLPKRLKNPTLLGMLKRFYHFSGIKSLREILNCSIAEVTLVKHRSWAISAIFWLSLFNFNTHLNVAFSLASLSPRPWVCVPNLVARKEGKSLSYDCHSEDSSICFPPSFKILIYYWCCLSSLERVYFYYKTESELHSLT